MNNVDRLTNLNSSGKRAHETQVGTDGTELLIDRFDYWGNPNEAAARSCYATYCRADDLAA